MFKPTDIYAETTLVACYGLVNLVSDLGRNQLLLALWSTFIFSFTFTLVKIKINRKFCHNYLGRLTMKSFVEKYLSSLQYSFSYT